MPYLSGALPHVSAHRLQEGKADFLWTPPVCLLSSPNRVAGLSTRGQHLVKVGKENSGCRRRCSGSLRPVGNCPLIRTALSLDPNHRMRVAQEWTVDKATLCSQGKERLAGMSANHCPTSHTAECWHGLGEGVCVCGGVRCAEGQDGMAECQLFPIDGVCIHKSTLLACVIVALKRPGECS